MQFKVLITRIKKSQLKELAQSLLNLVTKQGNQHEACDNCNYSTSNIIDAVWLN